MLIDENAAEVLKEAKIARITTIDTDGYPHTVPIWYMLEGQEVIMFTFRDSRKARNAKTNSQAALSVGGDPVGTPCYLIQGDLMVAPDEEQEITERITRHYETPAKAAEYLASWRNDPHVVLRLTPKRVIQIS